MNNDIFFDINEIMNTLPHRLKNAENISVILGAFASQLKEISDTFDFMYENYSANDVTGDMLDMEAENVGLVRLQGESDDDLKFRIELKKRVILTSGNVKSIDDVLSDILDIDRNDILIEEVGDAVVELKLNSNKEYPKGIISKINYVMQESKPVGVEFKTLLTSVIQFDIEIDRAMEVSNYPWEDFFMSSFIAIDDNQFMFDMVGEQIGINVSSYTSPILELYNNPWFSPYMVNNELADDNYFAFDKTGALNEIIFDSIVEII